MNAKEQILVEIQRLKGVWFDIEMEQRRLLQTKNQVEAELNKLGEEYQKLENSEPKEGPGPNMEPVQDSPQPKAKSK